MGKKDRYGCVCTRFTRYCLEDRRLIMAATSAAPTANTPLTIARPMTPSIKETYDQ